ncbi:thioredoxin family protein [Emticicia sp. BO119]|uniref:thioredoxin family protein n=1 Tax=Emticicia sp. BO119 TaxID=2757768 RepID=UPI0015F0E6AC|nr:thioredoxin family protein [Emticicia sp. BO119]MBA4850311.1 thioredoxin family protein [Emticicia sp. BO119]
MKKKMRFVLSLLVGLSFSSLLSFAMINEQPESSLKRLAGYGIGDAVTDFKLKNVDGKTVSLNDFASAKGFIVVFISNHCPFSKSYEDRVIDIDKKYASQGYPVIAINPNDPEAYEEDSFVNMQARAKEKGYTYPYLTDNTQAVTKAFGAMRTPHAFVLNKENGKIIVHYIGAIDDNPQDPANVTKHYVTDAINSLLLGKPVVTTITKAIGCAIKWKT